MVNKQPQHKHDGCPHCKFVASLNQHADIWLCNNPESSLVNLILRQSSEPSDYACRSIGRKAWEKAFANNDWIDDTTDQTLMAMVELWPLIALYASCQYERNRV